MDILNNISSGHEGETVTRLGSHFELSEKQIGAVLSYVVPYLEDALTRLMRSPEGLAAILAQLASGQYQRDLQADDIFHNSRIIANGTGALSLLLRNEATIRIISFVAAEGSQIDAVLIKRMMPFIATIYVSALARRSREPLQELAQRFEDSAPVGGHATYNLAQFVLSKSPMQKATPRKVINRGSIKDILNTLSSIEMDEETDTHFMK